MISRRILALGFAAAVALSSCASSQKRLAEQREKDPQYQYEKAVVCMQYGMTDEAVKYLQAAVALDARHYLSLNLLGLAYLTKGDVPASIRSFESCLAANPTFSEAHNNLGTAYQQAGETAKAEAAFKRAYEIDQNYNASYNLAKIAYQAGQADLALEYVQRSIQKYNKSLLAYNLLGLLLETKERYDDAILSYSRALELVPNEINVLYNLGVAYFKKGELEKAKETLERALAAIAKDPDPLKFTEVKARIQEALKRIVEK